MSAPTRFGARTTGRGIVYLAEQALAQLEINPHHATVVVQGLQQFFWGENEVNERLTQILRKAFAQVTARASRENVSMRTAAMATGVEKVQQAKRTRGLFP